jgi:hypothetical protein
VGQVTGRPPEGEGAAAGEPLRVPHLFRGQGHAAMWWARRTGLCRAFVQFVTLGQGNCFTDGWDDAARWLILRLCRGKAEPIGHRADLQTAPWRVEAVDHAGLTAGRKRGGRDVSPDHCEGVGGAVCGGFGPKALRLGS